MSLKLFGKKPSFGFRSYYNRVKRELEWDEDPRVMDIADHPSPIARAFDGSWEPDSHTLWLKRSLPLHLLEANAAHELTHPLLDHEGFPGTCPRYPLPPGPNGQMIQSIGGMLGSTFLDPIIDLRLRKLGFAVDARIRPGLHSTIALLNDPEFDEPPLDDWFGWLMALDYVHGSLILRPEDMARFDSAHKIFAPTIRAKGQELVELVAQTDYRSFTPEGCLEAMIAVRDALELQPICLIYDPRADQAY